MSAGRLSIAALLGVAAVHACDGPSYKLHKRADGDIGTFEHERNISLSLQTDDVDSVVI